ncbi:MAG: hypothetical protein MJ252_28830 [archaeon]|nr:hypothetical protein [archaeon]
MGCECVGKNNKSELILNDLNLDLNQKNKVLSDKRFVYPENKDLNISSDNINLIKHSNESDCENYKSSKKDSSFVKCIDSSTKMNTVQPIQHSITILTANKIENFKRRLLKEINNARENPQSFIPKVKKLMGNITVNSNGIYLKVDSKINIKLLTGKKAFESCLSFLQKQNILDPLFLKDETALDFPFDRPDICDDHDYLTKVLDKKKKELKSEELEIVNFHYDLVIPNPELSVLLQIVDDTNSMYQRRLNIFNEDAKYIGISMGKKTEGIICFYLLFAKDSE